MQPMQPTADMRRLIDLNISRFDSKLEQRTAELATRIAQLELRVEAKLERRLTDQILWFMAVWWGIVLAVIIALSLRK